MGTEDGVQGFLPVQPVTILLKPGGAGRMLNHCTCPSSSTHLLHLEALPEHLLGKQTQKHHVPDLRQLVYLVKIFCLLSPQADGPSSPRN